MISSRVARFPRTGLTALFLLLMLGAQALAQGGYTAQVRGTITDASGAVIPNATIVMTNEGTNISSTVKTDDKGLYTLTGLRPASYSMKVEATGFRAMETRGIVLAVNQQTTLNFTLHPLGTTETMTVTEAAPLLDTESAAIGTDVTNQYLKDIPLYNR